MVYSYIYNITIYIIIASVVGHCCSAIFSFQIKKVSNKNYCVPACAGQSMTLWGLFCPHLFLRILWSEFPVPALGFRLLRRISNRTLQCHAFLLSFCCPGLSFSSWIFSTFDIYWWRGWKYAWKYKMYATIYQ